VSVLLLVTGASGVGKSTVREMVEPELFPAVECVELVHLAPLAAARTRVWRQQTTERAACRAIDLEARGRHLLLCGDPVPAAEVVAAPSATSLDSIAACLLDVSRTGQVDRLAARGDHPALLVHHQAFA
jgi:predicted ABC-type ATPase